jgi:hypothetical protein
MNYILKYYNNLYEKRKEQLKQQQEIDNHLKTINKCQSVIIDFFILERQISRKLSEKQEEIPFKNLGSFAKDNIRNINEDYNKLYNILDSSINDKIMINEKELCLELQNFNINRRKKYDIK